MDLGTREFWSGVLRVGPGAREESSPMTVAVTGKWSPGGSEVITLGMMGNRDETCGSDAENLSSKEPKGIR